MVYCNKNAHIEESRRKHDLKDDCGYICGEDNDVHHPSFHTEIFYHRQCKVNCLKPIFNLEILNSALKFQNPNKTFFPHLLVTYEINNEMMINKMKYKICSNVCEMPEKIVSRCICNWKNDSCIDDLSPNLMFLMIRTWSQHFASFIKSTFVSFVFLAFFKFFTKYTVYGIFIYYINSVGMPIIFLYFGCYIKPEFIDKACEVNTKLKLKLIIGAVLATVFIAFTLFVLLYWRKDIKLMISVYQKVSLNLSTYKTAVIFVPLVSSTTVLFLVVLRQKF